MEWPLNTFAIHWKFLLSWGRWKLVLLERMLDWVFMYSNKLPLFFLVSFYAARISICIFGLVLRVQHLHLYLVLSEYINTLARSLTTEVSSCPFSQDSLLISFCLCLLSTMICPNRQIIDMQHIFLFQNCNQLSFCFPQQKVSSLKSNIETLSIPAAKKADIKIKIVRLQVLFMRGINLRAFFFFPFLYCVFFLLSFDLLLHLVLYCNYIILLVGSSKKSTKAGR